MFRAIIFDFDGVIADTEPLHYAAFARVLADRCPMPSLEAYFETYVGLNDAAFLRALHEQAGIRLDDSALASLLDRKNIVYLEMIAGGIPLLDGVEEFVSRVRGRYPLAICSGARRIEIETILDTAGLLDAFPVLVSSDEVPRSKPDPAGFLEVVARLGDRIGELRPDQCLAIEDSANGAAAAKAAGMKVVRVLSHANAASVAADLEVADLRKLTDQRLTELAAQES